jgi:hypothetical protein
MAVSVTVSPNDELLHSVVIGHSELTIHATDSVICTPDFTGYRGFEISQKIPRYIEASMDEHNAIIKYIPGKEVPYNGYSARNEDNLHAPFISKTKLYSSHFNMNDGTTMLSNLQDMSAALCAKIGNLDLNAYKIRKCGKIYALAETNADRSHLELDTINTVFSKSQHHAMTNANVVSNGRVYRMPSFAGALRDCRLLESSPVFDDHPDVKTLVGSLCAEIEDYMDSYDYSSRISETSDISIQEAKVSLISQWINYKQYIWARTRNNSVKTPEDLEKAKTLYYDRRKSGRPWNTSPPTFPFIYRHDLDEPIENLIEKYINTPIGVFSGKPLTLPDIYDLKPGQLEARKIRNLRFVSNEASDVPGLPAKTSETAETAETAESAKPKLAGFAYPAFYEYFGVEDEDEVDEDRVQDYYLYEATLEEAEAYYRRHYSSESSSSESSSPESASPESDAYSNYEYEYESDSESD